MTRILIAQMQSTTRLTRFLFGLGAAVAALFAVSASARAEDPFAIEPGSFATQISTNQAGAHPDLRTVFRLNTNPDGSTAGGTPKDLEIALPKGLIGAPTAVPTCPLATVIQPIGEPCPRETMVGKVTASLYLGLPFTVTKLVYNIKPYPGEPAAFAFNALYPVRLDTYVRTDGDYGVTASATNLTEAANVVASDLTLWGVPADHQGSGPESTTGGEIFFGSPLPGAERRPFLTNPTECSGSPLSSSITVDSWQHPGVTTPPVDYSLGDITGCDQLKFEPTIESQPTTNRADSPSGLAFDLNIPQNEDPDGDATSHLRDAMVRFPPGLTVNPASANGLAACSLAQVGMSADGQSDGRPVQCPDASKLGTVVAVSPAIDHPLPGSLYLATQGENPFGSLLATYLVIEDPLSGILVKLAGRVEPDPTTGQLTVIFEKNPQLPVEDLSLHLFKGDHAALKTPGGCGTYTTNSTMTPWSAPSIPASTPQSSFAITAGPSGGACLDAGAQAPNQPTFSAGTLNPTAGTYSPFVMKLTRADGTQPLKAIDATLPKGLLARLAGTPYCPDAALAAAAARSGKAEQASPSCPAASQVGSVTVGTGAGPDPFYAAGKAYLAGPYKGAPVSLAVVTPALAGPFDLGTVVVRSALSVDPITAQVHAISDPFPTILQGIPLDIRSIALNIDKPNFTLNPTSCEPASVLGGATSIFTQTVAFSQPFQVGDCARLRFSPSVTLALKGRTRRAGNPALTATINYPKGGQYANIAKTAVLLPKTEFIDNRHISNPCTRAQFNENACPAKSILGIATAYSPLLEQPLTGPVYFRSNGGERELPDMVVDLNGQIRVTLVGFIDSVGKKGAEKRRTRTRFLSVPDAPVSKFVLRLYGGKRGLIQNSVNLCRHPGFASVQMEAQNGNLGDFDTPFAAQCAKSKKHNGSKKKGHR
jgi:hypothetical protein